MNSELEIRESHDFETDLNCNNDFTGSFDSISTPISRGREGIIELESCFRNWAFLVRFLVLEALVSIVAADFSSH